jgi:hypothetical protein
MISSDTKPGLTPDMRARLTTRAADRRLLLALAPGLGSAADLERVRRLRALARLKTLVQAALDTGATPEEVLDAILAGDPELGPSAASQLLDGGVELLVRARRGEVS